MAILVQKSRRPRRWAGVAVCAAVLVPILWVEHRELGSDTARVVNADVPAADASFEPPAAVHLASLGPSFSAEPMAPQAPGVVTPPEGMSSEQWRALQESLKDHPQRDAEIARVAEYMAFSARLERLRSLRAQGTAGQAAARELAPGLLDGVPTHAARGELNAAEASLLQEFLLDTLLPDAAARQLRREQERKRLSDALPAPPDLRASAERNARFQREQAALVAAWQAQPAAQRDPQQLEASIKALRLSIFDDPQGKGGSKP